MNFIIYENALPVLEEHEAPEALKILLNRHEEFSDGLIECITNAAEIELEGVYHPMIVYSAYVNAVTQLRLHPAAELI